MSKMYCKICRRLCGTISHGGKSSCDGCGTPVANCHVSDERRQKARHRPPCPKCGSMSSSLIEPGRFQCKPCGSVFEELEVGFCDDRPDINLMKKERR